MIQLHISLARQAYKIHLATDWPSRGITALFGPSGCGKSSLLRCLAGLEPDCRGFISVNDEVWQDDAQGIFLKPYQRSVALAFQNGALFPHLSVRENLQYGLQRKGQKRNSLGFDEVVEMFDLGYLIERHPAALSGGETQRVAIGRTLLAHPSLLLLDEPLSGLDFQRKAEIMPFLERLHRELDIPVIYVSHLVGEVIRLADHLALMRQGELTLSAPLHQALLDDHTPSGLRNRAAVSLPCQVIEYDDTRCLARVDSALGILHIPAGLVKAGARMRLSIPADAVAPTSGTGRNPDTRLASVSGCSNQRKGQVLVRYEASGVALFGLSPIADLPQYPLQSGMEMGIRINESMLELATRSSPVSR